MARTELPMSSAEDREFAAAFKEALRRRRIGRPQQRGRDLRVYWAVLAAHKRGHPLSNKPDALRPRAAKAGPGKRPTSGSPSGKRSAFEVVAEQMCREAKCIDRRHWYATAEKIQAIYYRVADRERRAAAFQADAPTPDLL